MNTPVDSAEWIRRFHPSDDSKARLVCLPHAGGSAGFYFPFSAALTPSVETLTVQYPGRQDRYRETPAGSIAELAAPVVQALLAWTDRPLALFGHSMGAVVAFEVARRLENDHGITLAHVFASGRRAPSRVREENVHQRDDDGIVAEMRELSGTDARVLGDEEILRMVLPAIRADYRAIETYRCEAGAVISSPVTVFTGDNDPRTTLEEAESWRDHTTGDFRIQVYEGGHFFLVNHQPALVSAVTDTLARAGAR
ncbi:thioesterase II family protein [Streptomyces sp. NPDC001339]|uniref:thioesterase II family protein n=1 Tax=Streptomyces sp. NPDC001339 TaxID=3364563 RepID=UPI00369F092E